MIHYHGTPINPNDVLLTLRNSHFFVSYENRNQMTLVSEIASTYALDNGAYTAYREGRTVDWEKYADWVQRWTFPTCDFHVIPDVIGGEWRENMKLISGWTLPDAAPVWHMAEPLEMLRDLVASFRLVCIGGHVGQYELGKQEWWSRISQAMEAVCDDSGVPRCKLHGLKMLDVSLRCIPLHSADSTNLARHLSRPDLSRKAAAQLLIDRIERTGCALRWKGVTHEQLTFG